MNKAEIARSISLTYKEPQVNLDTVLAVAEEQILKAAKDGKFKVRLFNMPMVAELKKALKLDGFEVKAFKAYDKYYNQKLFTGEMEISWEPEKSTNMSEYKQEYEN
jgi:hypothetical protein